MRRAFLAVALGVVVASAGCHPFAPIPGLEGRGPIGDGEGPGFGLPSSPVTIPEEVGPPPGPVPASSGPSSEGVVGGMIPTALSDATQTTLECIKHWESGGDYATNTGNGFYGAYQADVGTWGGYGGYDTADEAPAAVQDAWAAELLSERGLQPWPYPAEVC